jgi:hypothetical protein
MKFRSGGKSVRYFPSTTFREGRPVKCTDVYLNLIANGKLALPANPILAHCQFTVSNREHILKCYNSTLFLIVETYLEVLK